MASEDWNEIDPTELPEAIGAEYRGMKEIYRRYKAARESFETAMQAAYRAEMPAGQELKFGYNFGKLSVAVGPARERKVKGKARQSLTDWLARQ